jgi:NADPH-dependent 2,4-dienoyl-CoA reductase/sulfur reductase-like enzyme/nitrite reductase/ring-hydroxylating ferredoxin subunit
MGNKGGKDGSPATQGSPTQGGEDGDRVEAVVAKVGEMADGEMREVTVGEGKALLVYQNGEYTACGHKCTHYGAPLVKGSLGNGRVRCPWHGACFNIKSGDIEDFPGLDGIHSFKVKTEGEDIIVQAKKSQLENFRQTMPMCGHDTNQDSRVFLIIGGGAAAQECAESLRQEGFKGRVVMATKEPCYPYDRPRLSKTPHAKAEELVLRKPPFYEEHCIEVLLEKEASGVNVAEKMATFTDGTTIKYDSLFLATGGAPRVPNCPGADLENVYVLRSPTQGNRIVEAAKEKHVVVIGVGFIGMEISAYLQDKAASVTVVGNGEPFAKVFGEDVGRTMRKLSESKGTKFILGDRLKEFVGEDGKLAGVVLTSGTELKADVCLAGIGALPATDFLKDSGLNMTERGEIVVDETMKAGEDVYAGGDIVRFPLPLIGDTANIGHWQIAHKHGRVAAKNMVGKKTAFDGIPFFWSLLLGKGIRFCGHSANWDELVTHGNLEEYKFVVHFIKGDKVTAVCTIGTNAAVVAAELMYQGKMLSADEIRSNPGALVDM